MIAIGPADRDEPHNQQGKPVSGHKSSLLADGADRRNGSPHTSASHAGRQSSSRPHLAQLFFSAEHPLLSAFHFEFVRTDRDHLATRLEAPEQFVADEASGELHTGFHTLILDTVMGGTVLGSLDQPQPIATVKLTTQHCARITAGQTIVCAGALQGVRNGVAYVHGEMRTEPGDELIATAIGSFMIGTRAIPLDGSPPGPHMGLKR